MREEAVDDAVMLALNEDAETYAPTLLEVAKLALHRPLASLGLVGILESRSSLRQRIERLLDFRPPRKAGLTLGSALAVLGFAALAVPMGEAPPPLHEVRNDRNGPLSLSLSPSEGERVPKAERLVYGPDAQPQVLAAAGAPSSSASSLATTNLGTEGQIGPPRASDKQPLYFRTFFINEAKLLEGLHVPPGRVGTNGWPPAVGALLDHLAQAGVDLLGPETNPGKALGYIYGDQTLLIRAPLHELDVVEKTLTALGPREAKRRGHACLHEPLHPDLQGRSYDAISGPAFTRKRRGDERHGCGLPSPARLLCAGGSGLGSDQQPGEGALFHRPPACAPGSGHNAGSRPRWGGD